MSTNTEDEKDSPKAVPLDLARNISSVRTVEGKTPIVMTNQSLRGMRVLTQSVPGSNPSTLSTPTIIATNLVSQAVLKTDSGRPQITGIITSNTSQPQVTSNLSRPTQITLSAPSQTIGTSYHVPRGPAVVANLAAPRSNVTTVRTPMVVAQGGQPHTFVRPPRSSSPASGTAWLTNSSTGSQIKGAPTVLSSPVRGATVTGKPAVISRTQPQGVSTIRPGAILQNAISIGQTGQIHSFKAGTTGIQALGNTVTIAQVLPTRTQAVVYSANSNAQFTPARITVATTTSAPRLNQPRPLNQVTTARLTVPVNVSQSGTRLITPQATVLSSGGRISAVTTTQTSTAPRIVTTQPNLSIGRLSVATATPTAVTNATFIGSTKLSTLNLHSLVAVANANTPPARTTISTQGPKVITQPAQGTIQLTAQLKTTPSIVSTGTRTISVPAAIVTQQRQATLVPSQAISIAKVFPQNDNPVSGSAPTNVFIHTPVQSTRHSSPSPNPSNCITQTSSTVPATTVATYSITSGTYFYDNAYSMPNRNFTQQQQTFSNQNMQIRPSMNTQVHGIVSNQQMRFNSVMVLEQNRGNSQIQQSQLSEQTGQQLTEQIYPTNKITSSPRPSILRKRDHEGSPLKAAKNLVPILSNLSSQQSHCLPPASPPSRPDSRGNGHSSGGSTTISATSSPGLAEINDDSNHAIINNKEEEETKPPPMEMSPRKKPRKQQLTGNDLDENKDDMEFISDRPIKKDEDSDVNQSDEPKDGAPEAGQVTTVRKPASASLLNSYRQNWKATHNHYLRHTDVKPKDERRPTIMDLANQYRVQDKVNGWKIHHLSTQMEDLADQEQTVYNQLTELLKCTESEEGCKQFNKEINRINELIKGNLQRIKIINDGMVEAKTSIMKIFDHKVHVTDIINRCASKRNFKKREKS
ncbi:histone deacetylase complex subunit SAP130-B isoform X1 [Diorhabda carinulata]|uniref:histone deacetylase complex subunit SAP130-B isoform X1 n=1 Tax=Diorhabda carinulata TaxID=1163345 RepID=UPI0025A267E5|nr:histone deacetylase complex subunit SAP130-B isoform X1 [Diorhabda carinulata]